MTSWITIITIWALALLALPAAAQQDTTAGGATRPERVTEDAGQGTAQDTVGRQTTAVPGAEEMGADSARLGRQGEGVTRPANVGGQRGEAAGAGGAAAPTKNYGETGQPGQAAETGGAMPTTASALPVVILIGSVLVIIGLAMRVLARR